jgi:hypothetical protein
MQGVRICDLRQDEHLVRPGAPEVRRVIEVRIGEPGVQTIAVVERAFEEAVFAPLPPHIVLRSRR